MDIGKTALGAVTLAMVAGMTVAGTANATGESLTIVPQIVQAGHWLEVAAHCAAGTIGPVRSEGLVAPINLSTGMSGQGQVVERPGHYTMSVECPDGTKELGQFTVTAEPPSSPHPTPTEFLRVSPAEVLAGQRVDVTGHCDSGAIGPVISDGFVAPVQLNTGWQAQAQAVDRPGRYQVSQTCGDGATVRTTLVVSGQAQPPSSTAPPASTTGPQVSVRPKGAPETGGGGMADELS